MLKLLYILVFLLNGIVCPPPLENRGVKISVGPHIDGVVFERDGDLNKNFRQEIVLNANMDIKTPKDNEEAIKNMFKITDKNEDEYLSREELEERVQKNLEEHLSKSIAEAIEQFKLVDKDEDGKISWDEFLPHLSIKEGNDDHKDEDGNHVMNREDTMRLEDEKRSFEDSDDNQDGLLNNDEWLSFLHPEHSRRGLFIIAENIVRAYDRNNDSFVSRDEFINGIPGSVDDSNAEFVKMEQVEKLRRQREFDNDIDTNKDEKATLAEIFEFVNPKNTRQVKSEVAEIMMIADIDNDERLSLDELLNRDWLLMSTSLISASNRLHDEM